MFKYKLWCVVALIAGVSLYFVQVNGDACQLTEASEATLRGGNTWWDYGDCEDLAVNGCSAANTPGSACGSASAVADYCGGPIYNQACTPALWWNDCNSTTNAACPGIIVQCMVHLNGAQIWEATTEPPQPAANPCGNSRVCY